MSEGNPHPFVADPIVVLEAACFARRQHDITHVRIRTVPVGARPRVIVEFANLLVVLGELASLVSRSEGLDG